MLESLYLSRKSHVRHGGPKDPWCEYEENFTVHVCYCSSKTSAFLLPLVSIKITSIKILRRHFIIIFIDTSFLSKGIQMNWCSSDR